MGAAVADSVIRVVVVDDDQLIVDGMARRARREIKIVEWCRSASGGAAIAIDKRPDVVAMDLSGVGNPWRAIKQIHQETDGEVPVLVVTGGSLITFADLAILHGASGIAAKRDHSIEVVAALKRVAGGGEYWSEPWGDRVAAIQAGETPTGTLVEDADLAILSGIAHGEDTSTIAKQLGEHERTVRRRLQKLREDLGVETDAHLIAELYRLRWIDDRALS